MTRILAAASPGEIRIALLDGDELRDYRLWRPATPDGLGDLYTGRVTARVPAMAGAFLTLGETDAFLPDSAGAAGLGDGDLVPVRITRPAQGGKGPRVRLDMAATAATTPGLQARGPSPLARLAAAHDCAPILIDDSALYASLRPSFGDRLKLIPQAFDAELEAELDALASPNLALPGGLRASIVPTPALIAIDIDGGASTATRGAKPRTQLAANLAAIPALARQIRLRQLAGAILIDFAGLPIKCRAALAPALHETLAQDPAQPRLLGFSHLGLAEILRPRGAIPLHEALAGPLAAGLAALRQAARHASENPHARLTLHAAPAIITSLQTNPAALAAFAHRATYPLLLQPDHTQPADAWRIEETR